MPIDWFTVVAQILNFVVLVWILKRFLYQPVLKAMAERQKRVENDLLSANREKQAASQERNNYEAKNKDLDSKRQQFLSEAKEEAEREHTRLVEEARSEYRDLRKRWKKTLDNERDELEQNIKQNVQKEALVIAGQLVQDLADVDLQEHIAHRFIKKLKALPADEKANLSIPIEESDNEAVLRSAFEPGTALRKELEVATREIIGSDAALRFEIKPSLGAGLELAVNGSKASWTVDNYLSGLDEKLRKLIEKESVSDETA